MEQENIVLENSEQKDLKIKAPRKLKKAAKNKVKRGKAKIYGHRINEVMEQKGMCDKELADLIDTNAPHMYRILKNERLCLSLPIAMKIAKALNTPIEELFFLDKPIKK